ncbi:MAG: hypothetical protein R2811_16775 [Flavobacteriales bacterium]
MTRQRWFCPISLYLRNMDVEAARAMALERFKADEYDHFGRPAYRLAPKKPGGKPGRTFMTLWPEEGYAVLMLDQELQARMIEEDPSAFRPHPSKWGQKGATIAELRKMGSKALQAAMALAHAHAGR